MDMRQLRIHVTNVFDQRSQQVELVNLGSKMVALVNRERTHGNLKPFIIRAGETVNLALKWLYAQGFINEVGHFSTQ
jgi:hypothetical protein